jgi:Flp pilus assembly protein TadG
MSNRRSFGAPLRRLAVKLGLARLKRDENGATAIEFAMVAAPFLMFMFALIGISTYFFVMTSLDRGMDKTSRKIRTGEAQNANMTVLDFKNQLCQAAGGWIKCNKIQVFVQKYSDWQSVQPQACVNSGGQVVTNTANGSDKIAQYSGSASDVVLITTCYKWDFAGNLPFFHIGNMADGSMMMQTATAFRTEPYSPAAGP